MTHIKQLPPIISISRAAAEVLGIDRGEAYKMAREGRFPGAFKFRRRWYVSVGAMLRGIQRQSS